MLAATGGFVAAAEWTATLTNTTEVCTNFGRNTYFILEPGYQLTLAGKENGKQTELVITVLNDTLEVAGVNTRVVEDRETADGKLIEVSRNYFALGTATGNLYYFGEDVDQFKAGGQVTHEGSWRAGRDGAQHGILIPGRPRVGDRYYQEQAEKVAMDRGENVSVVQRVQTALGTFKSCLQVKESSALEPGTEFKFYAPDVGLVQSGDLKLVKVGWVGR
jgi:hypothetical protein